MTDRPILFSAPMIRALLAGTKTQTRRILKPQPYANGFYFDGHEILCHIDELPPSALLMDRGKGKSHYQISNLEDGPEGMSGVYVGDRLWCREAWRAEAICDSEPPRNLQEDACQIYYPADSSWSDRDDMTAAGKLRPSMFMPRWASRLTLIVTGVKVERLQDISEEDAQAEGCDGGSLCVPVFRDLWKSINGPGSWEVNPWVVALTFTVHTQNIDALKEAA